MCSPLIESGSLDLLTYGYLAASLATLLAAAGAAVCAIRRRWQPALTLARFAVLGGAAGVVLGVLFVVVGVSLIADSGSASRATALGATISCAMNCGVFGFVFVLAGVVLWHVARRKVRRAPPDNYR